MSWLSVIGIGEDGWDGLSSPARAALEAADLIIGGDRHHAMAPHLKAERLHWPSPFRAMVDEVAAHRDRKVAVLVTGDPLWYSAGAVFARKFPGEAVFYPHVSAFQLAAARMGWSLADVETLTVHGRPVGQAIPFFAHDARLLILTQDASTPPAMAELLFKAGLGPSRMTILGALGGGRETRADTLAAEYDAKAPDFHVLAVECRATPGHPVLPRTGLPDDAFAHDGQMTKREIRALTLSSLAPRRGQRLWDIGAGCGSVGIEWMRADRDMAAIAIEPRAGRRAMIAQNAQELGAPRIEIIDGHAPDILGALPVPDAVFIGGGLSEAAVRQSLDALGPHGRLVANAVTLESEAMLADLQTRFGGRLSRVQVARAKPVGRLRGWDAFMPVTQWVVER